MNNVTQDIKDSAASILKDPFNSDSLTDFSAFATKDYRGGWSYWGSVEFQNGDTKGEQKFEAKSYKELLVKMQAFVATLEWKR